jgi:hypothetical protein
MASQKQVQSRKRTRTPEKDVDVKSDAEDKSDGEESVAKSDANSEDEDVRDWNCTACGCNDYPTCYTKTEDEYCPECMDKYDRHKKLRYKSIHLSEKKFWAYLKRNVPSDALPKRDSRMQAWWAKLNKRMKPLLDKLNVEWSTIFESTAQAEMQVVVNAMTHALMYRHTFSDVKVRDLVMLVALNTPTTHLACKEVLRNLDYVHDNPIRHIKSGYTVCETAPTCTIDLV